MYDPDIEAKCALCQKAELIPGTNQVLCEKYGVVEYNYVCKKYKYDIFKKKVRRRGALDTNYSEEDFSIE